MRRTAQIFNTAFLSRTNKAEVKLRKPKTVARMRPIKSKTLGIYSTGRSTRYSVFSPWFWLLCNLFSVNPSGCVNFRQLSTIRQCFITILVFHVNKQNFVNKNAFIPAKFWEWNRIICLWTLQDNSTFISKKSAK